MIEENEFTQAERPKTEEENEFTDASYQGFLSEARCKRVFNSNLNPAQRERILLLIRGAETLHAAGQYAAATDILMICCDFADGYKLTPPPPEEEPKPTPEQFDAATEARKAAEDAAALIQSPEEKRVMEFLIADAGEALPANPLCAKMCYEAAERHARFVLHCEAKEKNKEEEA